MLVCDFFFIKKLRLITICSAWWRWQKRHQRARSRLAVSSSSVLLSSILFPYYISVLLCRILGPAPTRHLSERYVESTVEDATIVRASPHHRHGEVQLQRLLYHVSN